MTALTPSPPSILVLTRPLAQAADWLQRLAVVGVTATSLPLIEIVAADGQAADLAWQDLPAAGLAMFVSPNAVQQFFASRPAGQGWPARTLAACVGPGSARALLAAGVPAEQIVQPPANSASLDSEHLWPQLSHLSWTGQRVLMLRGGGGREWLADRLREGGAEVRFYSVYQRRCPQLDAVDRALLDAVLAEPGRYVWLFSSAEAIGYLQQLVPAGQDWSGKRCIATHERIAERARLLGLGRVVLTRPSAAAVAQALHTMQGSPLQSFSL